MVPRHRFGHEAATHATQQRLDLGFGAGDGQHILAGQQVDRHRCQPLRAIGHRHGAVGQQFGIADRPMGRCQRVVRRHRENELQFTQRIGLDAWRRRRLGANADGQVRLARDQRFPGAGQHLGAQAQPGSGATGGGAGRALRVQRVEGLAQLEHRDLRYHAVHSDAELCFPTGGDAPHTVRHRLHFGQQPPPFGQQFLARGGELGLARTAVEKQHVERVFELAHVVGQCRGHLAEFARRGSKAAGAGDGVHHRQGFGGQDLESIGHGLVARGGFILFECGLQGRSPPRQRIGSTVATSLRNVRS
jgi:hypothetical protein